MAHAARGAEIGEVGQDSGERWYDLGHGFLLADSGSDIPILPEESSFDFE
jgi:hypothetical protein